MKRGYVPEPISANRQGICVSISLPRAVSRLSVKWSGRTVKTWTDKDIAWTDRGIACTDDQIECTDSFVTVLTISGGNEGFWILQIL